MSNGPGAVQNDFKGVHKTGSTPTPRAEEAEAKIIGLEAQRDTLKARVAVMDAALEPFSKIADEYADQEDDDFQVWRDFDVLGATLPLRIFRRAREAHAKGGGEWVG